MMLSYIRPMTLHCHVIYKKKKNNGEIMIKTVKIDTLKYHAKYLPTAL